MKISESLKKKIKFGVEDSVKEQRCEYSFPSREIGYNEKRRGCPETDVIAARDSNEHL